MSDYDQKSALAFNSSKVSKVWSDRRFRFAECIIPPKLNNRSTGADDGIIVLYLRNNCLTFGNGEKIVGKIQLEPKSYKMYFKYKLHQKNVIEIQNTISNFIKIQDTSYSKCISITFIPITLQYIKLLKQFIKINLLTM